MKEINIWDIEGVRIGNAQNLNGGTGCTAIICEKGASAGVDVRGGGPASRETELLKPLSSAQFIHGVMLSGGSAFGLAACDGAMKYLEKHNIGFDTGAGLVPLLCGASIFDLIVGDSKCRPDSNMGYQACVASETNRPKMGNVGAGTGATVGKYLGMDRMMKSGLGIYAAQIENIKCGVVVVVNALGDVLDWKTGKKLAGILNKDKTEILDTVGIMQKKIEEKKDVFSGNTTLGCIVTNSKLTKNQANKLACITHNGYAKTISPVHTSVDGDSIFTLATGDKNVSPDVLGTFATEVMERAINKAVENAKPAYGLKCAMDFK